MASDIDICNLALSHLGDDATVSAINPPDGSAQAQYCATFYPLARDRVLASHAWGFATKRQALALLSTTELPSTWQYAYALPSSCLQPISVLVPQTVTAALTTLSQFASTLPVTLPSDNDTQDFVVESLQDGTQALFTNAPNAILRYVDLIVDTTKFPPLVIDAVARLLASYLAGPIVKGEAGMKLSAAQLSLYDNGRGSGELILAKASDSRGRQQNVYHNPVPDAIKARQ
jgi:hypothetical protein